MRKLLERGALPIVLFFLAAAGAAGYFLPRFGVEAGTNVLLNEDDPDLAFYNITRADWTYDEYAIVCVRREEWFSAEGIDVLKALEAELKTAPHVSKVQSILTVPLLRNKASAFGLPAPTSLTKPDVKLDKAKEELLGHTQALGNLISADGRDLNLLAYLDVPPELLKLDPEWSRAQGKKDAARLKELATPYAAVLSDLKVRRDAMIAAVRKITAAWGPPRLAQAPRLSGLPIITVNLVEHTQADLANFGVASFAAFVVAFAVVYRRVRWTLCPIVACLLPVVLILGTMSAFDKKVTVITSNLPVLLFTLMLPYTVYLVERYRERRGLFPGESQAETVATSAREIWTPCLYSATTTMAGFASLVTSGIVPMRTFGLMMTIGIAVGLACVFVFLPAANVRLRPLPGPAEAASPEPRGVVRALALAVLKAPMAIVLFSAALLGVSVWGATKLNAETKFIDYFWPSSEVYRGLDFIDNTMGGTTPLEVMLSSKTPGYFKTPEGVAAIAAAESYFAGVKETGNVRSFKTLVDEGRKALPKAKDPELIKLVASLPTARDLVREFCNEDFTVSRVLVRFRETAPTLHRNNILRGLREHLAKQEALKDVEARPTGIFLLYANMLNSLLDSQRETFLWVVGAIFAMLVVLFRSLALSLVVLVPQVLPVFVCLGTMGWAKIPLDLVTVMIGSVAMGVGIDAAIQYAVRFRIELEAAGGDFRAAVLRSHATIGRAIWIATSIVVAGFVILALSKFVPSVYFGIFTALAMLMGQFAALTLLPALFLLLGLPKRRSA
ncbi:MAG TPA: MMPL family transporter [Planctomycetota bacterium]